MLLCVTSYLSTQLSSYQSQTRRHHQVQWQSHYVINIALHHHPCSDITWRRQVKWHHLTSLSNAATSCRMYECLSFSKICINNVNNDDCCFLVKDRNQPWWSYLQEDKRTGKVGRWWLKQHNLLVRQFGGVLTKLPWRDNFGSKLYLLTDFTRNSDC